MPQFKQNDFNFDSFPNQFHLITLAKLNRNELVSNKTVELINTGLTMSLLSGNVNLLIFVARLNST
jgi:hypothetical protein